MTNQNVIRNLKDFHAVASKLFKCGAKRITDETHAKGYMGVKLIVGEKMNPAYDATANPAKPNLTPEERQVERNKLIKMAPDIRIVWVRPGMTAEELTKEFLLGIKKSLERKTPVIDTEITGISTMGKQEKTDAEIAAEIAAGKQGEAELNEFDDETEEIGFDEGEPPVGTAHAPDEETEEEVDVENLNDDPKPSANNEILEAIQAMNKNIETIAGDVGELNKRIKKVEKKVK